MSSSEAASGGTCILEVDSALETACFRGVTMTIVRVEVWGCGGEKAAERQQKMKEWEKQLILKRRKVTTKISDCAVLHNWKLAHADINDWKAKSVCPTVEFKSY